MKTTNLRAPRCLNDCRFDPEMAPIKVSLRKPQRAPWVERALMAMSLIVMLIVLTACGMTNDEVIAEIKKCEAAGLRGVVFQNATNAAMVTVVCLPRGTPS